MQFKFDSSTPPLDNNNDSAFEHVDHPVPPNPDLFKYLNKPSDWGKYAYNRTNSLFTNLFLGNRLFPVPCYPWVIQLGRYIGDPLITSDFHTAHLSFSQLECVKNRFDDSPSVKTYSGISQGNDRRGFFAMKELQVPAKVVELGFAHAILKWDEPGNNSSMSAPIVMGMPYVTMKYENATPVVGFQGGETIYDITPVNQDGTPGKSMQIRGRDHQGSTLATATKFYIRHVEEAKENSQIPPLTPNKRVITTYILYCSEAITFGAYQTRLPGRPTTGEDDANGMVATEPKNVTLRMVVLRRQIMHDGMPPAPGNEVQYPLLPPWGDNGSNDALMTPTDLNEATFDTYKEAIPVKMDIDCTVNANKIRLQYNISTESGSGDLITYALPHHQDRLVSPNFADGITVLGATDFDVNKSRCWSSFGDLKAVKGKSWTLEFDYIKSGYNVAKSIDPDFTQLIKDAIKKENTLPEPFNEEFISNSAYNSGRQLTNLARMLEIIDSLDQGKSDTELQGIKTNIIDKLEVRLKQWLGSEFFVNTKAEQQKLLYDRQWGGVNNYWGITRDRVAGHPDYHGQVIGIDFFQSYYNDSHFHFGYFIYAATILEKNKRGFLNEQATTGQWTYLQAIMSMIRSVANPSPKDSFFPLMRHFDFWWCHSWANGMAMPMGDPGSRNQESVSEAINCWYGIQLLGELLQNQQLEELGGLMLSMEVFCAQWYWQVPGLKAPMQSQRYPKPIVHRQWHPYNAAQHWALQMQLATFFGPNLEYSIGIVSLPFSPVTEQHIKPYWTDEIKSQILDRLQNPAADPNDPKFMPGYDTGWQWAMLSLLAVSDKNLVKHMLSANPLDVTKPDSTLTNALWWIATR